MNQLAHASVLELSQLNRIISMIGKRSTQVHGFIQQAAVGCVGHSILYGDIRPGNALLAAVHTSQRRDALVKYLETFGCFKYEAKAKKFTHVTRDKLVWDADYLAKVARFDWAHAKKAPEPTSLYDVAADLSALIGRAQRAIEQGKKEIKHASLLDALATVFNAWESENAKKEQAIRDALRQNATEDAEAQKQASANPSTVTTGTTAPAPQAS